MHSPLLGRIPASFFSFRGVVIADGDLVIIQNYGVHPGIWVDDTSVVGDHITMHATAEGEGVTTTTPDASGADYATVLATGVSTTMGDAQHNCIGWVKHV